MDLNAWLLIGTFGGSDNGHTCQGAHTWSSSTQVCTSRDKGRRWCMTSRLSQKWGYCFTSKQDAQRYQSLYYVNQQTYGQICKSSKRMSRSSQLKRCPDGSCVLDYPSGCLRRCNSLSNMWKCDDGYCIKELNKCDSKRHCIDGSDERNCALNCGRGQWECRDKRRCIYNYQKCNNYNDCLDGSDEDFRECDNYDAPSDEFDNNTLIGVVVAAVGSGTLFCLICLCKRRTRSESNGQSQNPETHNLTGLTSSRPDPTSSPRSQDAQDPSSRHEVNGDSGRPDMDALYQSPPEYSTATMYSVPSTEPSAPPMDFVSPMTPVPDPVTMNTAPAPGYDPDAPEPSAPPPAYNDVMSDTAQYNLYVPGQDPLSASPLLSRR